MKIAIDIDAELLESVMEASGDTTESGAVNAALEEYARRKGEKFESVDLDEDTRRENIQKWIDSWGKVIVDDYSKDEGLMRANERRHAFLESLWDDPR